MGLTLHYKLRLPGTMSPEEVDAVLERLHAHSLPMGFDVVSDPARLSESSFDPEQEGVNNLLRFMTSVMSELAAMETPPRQIDPDTARGFLIQPADGSESATIGFVRESDPDGENAEWFWQCGCKTQYASVTSDEYFVKCHKSLVEYLDRVVATGVGVEVFDEGMYWDTRDEEQLLAEVRRMNRIMAAFAGRLSDALGAEHDVQAEIFRHPRFEHLEVERLDDL